MGAPVEYYRVQDKSSATRFNKVNGFIAGDDELPVKMSPRSDSEYQNLFEALDRHLDWYDRTPSPFISVYADYDTAENSAIARAERGKKGVFIAHINVKHTGGLSYRCVPKLAEAIGLRIPQRASRNAEEEFVFLHRIPAKAVTKYEYFE